MNITGAAVLKCKMDCHSGMVRPTGFPGGSVVKNPPAIPEKRVRSLGWEDSLGGGNGNSLQYSCLGNPMDRGAWRITVYGLARVGHDLASRLLLPLSVGLDGKESACNVGDPGSIPGWGRSSGEGNGNPFQDSCLENPVDREAWWATVHGVVKSQTRLSDFTYLLRVRCAI